MREKWLIRKSSKFPNDREIIEILKTEVIAIFGKGKFGVYLMIDWELIGFFATKLE